MSWVVKIVLIGESGVGKSSIMTRFCFGTFDNSTKSTIGIEFERTDMEINGESVRVRVWDTAGQDRYRAVVSTFYRQARGALLIYDITKPSTFAALPRWLNEARQHADQDLEVIVVGNKSDLNHLRAVSTEEGAAFARAHGLSFIETSACDATNVKEAFREVLTEIMKQQNLRNAETENEGTFNPDVSIEATARPGGCPCGK